MEYLLLAFSVLLGACKTIVTKLARCPSGDLEGTAKIKHLKKLRITKENHRNQVIPVIFGGDYWTRTSDLLRAKIR